MKNIQTPKGTRDFYPDAMRLQNHIQSVWREVCLRYGYEEYESPTFEHLELYTRKSGDEIVSQLYHFQDKSGRDLALRPEMTPTLARMINQKGPSLKMPIRWFCVPRMYRYERSQKGRLREFFQLNMDIVGSESLWAETELISAIADILLQLGLAPEDFSVRISSRNLLNRYLENLQLNQEETAKVYAALDKWGKVSQEAFQEMLPAKLGKGENLVADFLRAEGEDSLRRFEALDSTREAAGAVRRLLDSLKTLGYGASVAFDSSIVRGLAYYTGIVFEVFDKGKNFRAIAGGGRYDNLLEHLGGRPLSGVGFGFGDVVLAEILKEKGLLPELKPQLDYYIAHFDAPGPELASLAQRLRRKGRRVAFALDAMKLKKQLSQAEEWGARAVIFFGSDKASGGQCEVKYLETREQKLVAEDQL